MTDDEKEAATVAAQSNANDSNTAPPWLRRPGSGQPKGKNLGLKFFLLGVLAFLLCIPLFMVWGLVKEREHNYRSATAEIGRQWGAAQTINGPYLSVPVKRRRSVMENNRVIVKRENSDVLIAPDQLSASANVETTTRKRGIHEAVVYQSTMDMRAEFSQPDLNQLADDIVSMDWSRAKLVLSVSDMKGIVDIDIKSDGRTLDDVEPGLGLSIRMAPQTDATGLHAPLDLDGMFNASDASTSAAPKELVFDLAVTFKGSQSLTFVPVGESTRVTVASTWPHPSFSGSFLPTNREISDEGFDANWTVSKLARSIAQLSFANSNSFNTYAPKGFGVRFYQPVDFYRLVDRAVKYGVLFIGMVFLIIFSVEILSKGRMHAVHYTMAGLMVVMFYILLLALAEFIGFSLAYGVAAGATGAVLASFVATFFKGRQASIGAVTGFSLLYGLLYLVLSLEDAALIAGAVTGFVILTIMMFATRNIDWSGRQQVPETNPA